LLPSLKLCGKKYSSFAYVVEAAWIEEQHLGEAERRTWERKGRVSSQKGAG